MPKELVDYLNSTSAGKLWFDIGQHQVSTQRNPLESPTVIGTDQGATPLEPGPSYGSSNAAEHDQHGSKSEAYNIYSKPWQVMAQFQAMSYNDPARFAMLQQALGSGAFGKVNINGVFDHSTEAALGQAMLQYVKLSMGTEAAPVYKDPKTGKTSGGFVGYLLTSATSAYGHAQQNALAGQQVNLTDPESIKQAALQAAQQALGQSISGDQLNKFVQSFQAAQTSAQTQIGGSVTQPDISADAMAFAQKSNPDEFKANQRMSYLDQLVNLLGGNRPNQSPTPGV